MTALTVLGGIACIIVGLCGVAGMDEKKPRTIWIGGAVWFVTTFIALLLITYGFPDQGWPHDCE
ncbi:hypothetical protein FK530_22960 [Tsukamurella conjunctivitidis]|uniref:Uncharacterized protein n=1 Tax=Tsukamurella conjunctivitidis TaxID=2592068 RepID=A0A5C5RSJ7_9ACTN|nr:hypothetical protein [Tsukamurella conjunctivitidis]TWS25582.1 hypothetical protein FK530_22960 [Tsukamurella conjunctivitidis]